MPGMDLASLTQPELKQLLRLARGRDDGPLIDRLEWELAERASLSTRVGFPVGTPVVVGPEPDGVWAEPVR
ncbi:MAG TPA: hypothetical protein VFE03_03590, partial [Caulobacteraceae bacterium]|nr:hypothetical protein [Caulobacteraceae bacterium]